MTIFRLPSASQSPRAGRALAAVVAAAVLAASGCSGSSGAAGPAGSGSGALGAVYHGPSWASYLDTRPGRTCTLKGSLSAGLAGSILSVLAQRVVSRSRGASGETVRYQLRTATLSSLPQSQGGIPSARSSLTVPYEILDNGELGVSPGSYSLLSGLQVTLRGFQVYPAIADLGSGRAITSVVSGYLTGTTAAARKQAAQMTPDGQPLRFQVNFSVAGLPHASSIKTPSGTYHQIVAVRVATTRMTVLNGRPAVKKAFSASAGLAQASGANRLYFARGTGLVEVYSGGVTERLASCAG